MQIEAISSNYYTKNSKTPVKSTSKYQSVNYSLNHSHKQVSFKSKETTIKDLGMLLLFPTAFIALMMGIDYYNSKMVEQEKTESTNKNNLIISAKSIDNDSVQISNQTKTLQGAPEESKTK